VAAETVAPKAAANTSTKKRPTEDTTTAPQVFHAKLAAGAVADSHNYRGMAANYLRTNDFAKTANDFAEPEQGSCTAPQGLEFAATAPSHYPGTPSTYQNNHYVSIASPLASSIARS